MKKIGGPGIVLAVLLAIALVGFTLAGFFSSSATGAAAAGVETGASVFGVSVEGASLGDATALSVSDSAVATILQGSVALATAPAKLGAGGFVVGGDIQPAALGSLAMARPINAEALAVGALEQVSLATTTASANAMPATSLTSFTASTTGYMQMILLMGLVTLALIGLAFGTAYLLRTSRRFCRPLLNLKFPTTISGQAKPL